VFSGVELRSSKKYEDFDFPIPGPLLPDTRDKLGLDEVIKSLLLLLVSTPLVWFKKLIKNK